MTRIREILISEITEPMINDLEQFGFTLVHKEKTIELWVESES